MKEPKTIPLGFEIPSGERVDIPVGHLCVTGQTQLSGKTTTLEALVSRSGLKAIAFVTKRGEGAFSFDMPKPQTVADDSKSGHWLPPFFKHRADWQFVSDILGAILHEKLKWERANIIKVSRGAKTLEDVHVNIKQQLAKKLRPIDESIYTQLDAYFDILIPEIERLPYTDTLELQSGLNVMDLSEYSQALQMLVISSVLDEVYKHHKGVITVIPEAWEFVPNNKNAPSKSSAITLARKGAALQNFLWLDSQDLASIDTEVRRAVSVWILGVQREQNEVKRLLSHIPNVPKPKADEIMQLELGKYFVCHGREMRKVYVWPAWMGEDDAHAIAIGANTINELQPFFHRKAEPSTKELKWRVETDAPPDSVHLLNPKEVATSKDQGETWNHPFNETGFADLRGLRLLEIDPNDYAKPPRGIPYYVEREPPWFPARIYTRTLSEDDDMDQAEREKYDTHIRKLEELLYKTLKQLPSQNYAKEHSFEEWRVDVSQGVPGYDDETEASVHTATKERPAKGPGQSGKVLFDAKHLIDAILNSDSILSAIAERIPLDPIISAVAARLPANGVVKVAPKEAILRQFQEAAVESLLAEIGTLSKWQMTVIKYMEAKDARANKADIFRAIEHRDPPGGSVQQDRYKGIDDLVAAGWLRKDDSNRLYPNLVPLITERLKVYSATEEDVAAVRDAIILKIGVIKQ